MRTVYTKEIAKHSLGGRIGFYPFPCTGIADTAAAPFHTYPHNASAISIATHNCFQCSSFIKLIDVLGKMNIAN